MKILLLCAALISPVIAQQLPNADLLNQPPRPATAANCPKVDDWSTPAEKSCYRTTPRYDETMAYVRRVAAAAPKQIKVESIGKTGQGRELVSIIVSKDGVFDPTALHKADRPIVYIQNAIHAGEMDGKDASLALLRDIVITKSRASLIDRAVLVLIPIYNADGHEFFGPYNRINQNGPEQMGWRTNARQLNLNRDYMKADAPETRAFLQAWNRWLPDFFIDDHVTDGADYQYDITYFLDTDNTTYPELADWLHATFTPELESKVNATGHMISPYIDFIGLTADTGLTTQQSPPRFATGYINLQNRPSMLVEMHMLKDYRTRVTGNYETLRAVLEIVNRGADKIIRMNRAADAATVAAGRAHHSELPIVLEPSGDKVPFHYKGYKWTVEKSEVSGGNWVRYTHDPIEIDIPRLLGLKSVRTATIPAAYIVPAEWTPIIDILTAHGLQLRRTSALWSGEVDAYRCETPAWQQQPFEAHHLASWPKEHQGKSGNGCTLVREKMSFPAGSVVVPMDQRAAKIAMHFLEPEAPDSAVVWGYFDTVFEQKEYGEAYVLEKLAREMLARDPKLKAEYEQKVASDPSFTNSYARLNWFYRRSPWWDDRVGLIPVGKLQTLDGIPLAK
jgi:hypothetical protein